jgi:NADH-quinone oxidoreductase subunit J
MTALLFYMLSGITLMAAVGVVLARHPMINVLCLIVAFLNGAGLFLLAGSEFVALLMIIVYVGAIAILFIFLVMTIDMASINIGKNHPKSSASIALVGLILCAELWAIVYYMPSSGIVTPKLMTAQTIGRVLYTDYGLAFQLAGIVLFLAMIGAITLTFNPIRHKKRPQNLDRTRDDVVSVVSVNTGEGVDL